MRLLRVWLLWVRNLRVRLLQMRLHVLLLGVVLWLGGQLRWRHL